MTGFLTWLFGRLPIGWLQLTHNRGRLAAAVAGVGFANVLIFMQLGFLGALQKTAVLPYSLIAADVMVSAPDANTLSDGSPVPRARMLQALAVAGVAEAAPLFVGRLDWDLEDGSTVNLTVLGIDPRAPLTGLDPGQVGRLRLLDTALLDTRTRNLPKERLAEIQPGRPVTVELANRRIDLVDTVTVGAGFEADGFLVTSDETFLHLFPGREAGAPSHVLLRLAPEADATAVIAALRDRLPAADSVVRTTGEMARADQRYQTGERPIGVVFGFGVVIGVLVGVVIVYQVLTTDVSDHLRDYATLKAMGYGQRFFLGIVFEEALILALMGFVPGVVVASVLYALVGNATGLPLAMEPGRAPLVFFGTLAMCTISGALATRRLAAADPAELF